jgi:hypothetical protein
MMMRMGMTVKDVRVCWTARTMMLCITARSVTIAERTGTTTHVEFSWSTCSLTQSETGFSARMCRQRTELSSNVTANKEFQPEMYVAKRFNSNEQFVLFFQV